MKRMYYCTTNVSYGNQCARNACITVQYTYPMVINVHEKYVLLYVQYMCPMVINEHETHVLL